MPVSLQITHLIEYAAICGFLGLIAHWRQMLSTILVVILPAEVVLTGGGSPYFVKCSLICYLHIYIYIYIRLSS